MLLFQVRRKRKTIISLELTKKTYLLNDKKNNQYKLKISHDECKLGSELLSDLKRERKQNQTQGIPGIQNN